MTAAIIVTGTPGTGKTTVAMQLAKRLKYEYIDVNRIIKNEKLSEGYDRKRLCKIIDIKKLNRILGKIIKNSKKKVVIDSHLSHHLPVELVDMCVVTKCNLKLLNMRLKKRKYPLNKIKENLQCEIFDVCLNEAHEKGHKTIIFDTDRNPDYSILIKKIKRIKK